MAFRLLLLVALVVSGCLGCQPEPHWLAVHDIAWQPGEALAEGAWQPVDTGAELDLRRVRVAQLRVRTPPIEVDDPALRLSHARLVGAALVDGRPIDLHGSRFIIPVRASGSTVVLRMTTGETITVPGMMVGSQRTFWSWTVRREVPHAMVGGLVLVAGLLMLFTGMVRRGAKAYAALGLFLSSLGTLTLLNLRGLGTFPMLRPELYNALHNTATLCYPVGFVYFAVATFGDSRRRVLHRGFRLYLVYVAVALGLDVGGVIEFGTSRAGVGLFIAVFALQAIVLAAQLARRGDRSGVPFLAGIAVLLGFGFHDMFSAIDYQWLPFGLLAFGIAMVMVLESKFTQARLSAQTSAEQLALKMQALEERHREVQSLNVELRHQIAERSKQMVALLQSDGAAYGESRLLQEGEAVGERYRVLRMLGQGGMGAVYEVERTTDAGRFALKVMAGTPSPVAAARFAREAEIAARIIDDHLVSVVDISGAGSSTLYFVMELIQGRSLDEARERFGDVRWGLGVLKQILRGLMALHAAGVVHRDLKPGNVLLSAGPDGQERARIADFGISSLEAAGSPDSSLRDAGSYSNPPANQGAHDTLAAQMQPSSPGLEETLAAPAESRALASGAVRAVTPALTATGVIMGTPAYMAPELLGGARAARPASDMFAFGLIAFEVLSGERAFELPPSQMLFSSKSREPRRALPSDLPSAAATAILSCLDFDPGRRPTAREALEALDTA